MFRLFPSVTLLFCATVALASVQKAFACDLNSGPSGLAACDRVLEAGTARLESFVNELSQNGASGDKATELLRNFYLSATYFRLALAERSQTLKCEYVDASQAALQQFKNLVAQLNVTEYKSFILRGQVFGAELTRQNQCLQPGMPAAKFDGLLDSILSARLKDAFSSPSWREATFQPVFREIANVVKLTSTTLTKIETTKNSLENTKLELAEEPLEGEVTKRVRLFTKPLQDGTPTDIVGKRNQDFRTDLDGLHVDVLLENKERLKVAAQNRAAELLGFANNAEGFVKSVLEDDTAFKQVVGQVQRRLPVLQQSSGENLNSIKRSAVMLRGVLSDACAASSPSHTEYYCRYQ